MASIHVCVNRATNLPSNVDWWPRDSRPDSYAQISLVQANTMGISGNPIRSQTINNNVNPVWNYCGTLTPLYNPNQPIYVRIAIIDNDLIGEDRLGDVYALTTIGGSHAQI